MSIGSAEQQVVSVVGKCIVGLDRYIWNDRKTQKQFSAGEISVMLLVPAHLSSMDFLRRRNIKAKKKMESIIKRNNYKGQWKIIMCVSLISDWLCSVIPRYKSELNEMCLNCEVFFPPVAYLS